MAISTGAAILGGAAISGLMGAKASSDAASAQESAANASNATQKYIFDQQRADNAPFLNNGTAASNQLAKLLGIAQYDAAKPFQNNDANAEISRLMARDGRTREQVIQQIKDSWGADYAPVSSDPAYGSLLKPITQADIEADPVYSMGLQFGLDEGTKGINRQAAATGSALSGATLKALTRFGNDYASTKGNDAVNRISAQRQQQYSMLGGVSGAGQAAAGQTSAAAQSFGNNVSQTAVGLGNARAASAIGGANALSGAISSGINGYQGNQLLQALQRNGGYGSAGSIYNGGYNYDNGNMIGNWG